jgi:23S rRNA pseudouridine1911/1915/1917 synthase
MKISLMQVEKLAATVPADHAGKRLDQALAALFPQHSRSRLQEWIRGGRVLLNGQPVSQRHTVKTGDAVVVHPVALTHAAWAPEAIKLDIRHEDKALLIINKPAGLVVHPGAGNPDHTLLNALLHHDAGLLSVPRAGIIQRLDKDTSGLMVIARTPEAHTFLVEQMRRRLIRREYEAIVCGTITSGGSIDAPIGRHQTQRTRMAVTHKGKLAVTHYRIIRRYRTHTHLRLRLETGRTHQIRVHMASIHHPIVGDPVYGGRARLPAAITEDLRNRLKSFPRQALHACYLELTHPITGDTLQETAPLPEDMRGLLDDLERVARGV